MMIVSMRAVCLSTIVFLIGAGPVLAQFGGGGPVRVPKGQTNPLVDAITSAVAPDSWDVVGGPGVIKSLDAWGLLVVSQTEDVHEEIGILLDRVRLAKTQQGDAEDDNANAQNSLAVERPEASKARELIEAKLESKTDFEFVDLPLDEVVGFLAEKHEIPVVIDIRVLEEIGIGPDTPLTLSLRGVSLRSALRLLLRDLELTYTIRDEVMQITTHEVCESRLLTRVYKVKDLMPAAPATKSSDE